MRFSPSRTLLSLAITSLGLVVVSGPVLGHQAGDGDTHRGKFGRHAFPDSKKRPGARCIYQAPDTVTDVAAAGELAGVSVRPPKVAAIDRTRRVDRQRVGWRFVLLEKMPGEKWTKIKRSSLQVRRTTDRRAANFSRMALRYDGDRDARYRVKTKAYWFKPRLNVVGAATHRVRAYQVRGNPMRYCPGSVPVPVAEPS